MATKTVRISNKVVMTVSPQDFMSHNCPVDGVPVWAVSPATLATITPAADGFSALLVPGNTQGAITVTISADSEMDGGVRTITHAESILLIEGEAVTLNVSYGAEQPK